MPKGIPNKRYTPEFKQLVVETMREEHLSVREVMQRFKINDHGIIERWERLSPLGPDKGRKVSLRKKRLLQNSLKK